MFSKKNLWTIALSVFLAAAVATLFALSIKARGMRGSVDQQVLQAATPVAQVQGQKPVVVTISQAPERPEGVLIVLKPTGFEPAEMIYPHRPFNLMVQNLSGEANLSFKFDGKFADSRKTKRAPRRRAFGGLVDLPPGTYKVSEENHPQWVFTLVITKDRE